MFIILRLLCWFCIFKRLEKDKLVLFWKESSLRFLFNLADVHRSGLVRPKTCVRIGSCFPLQHGGFRGLSCQVLQPHSEEADGAAEHDGGCGLLAPAADAAAEARETPGFLFLRGERREGEDGLSGEVPRKSKSTSSQTSGGGEHSALLVCRRVSARSASEKPLVPVSTLSPLVQASLVVNVASRSEQTEANYRSLQELHRELGTSHFNVLAFPCGQFGDTETGLSRDIEAFAKSAYSVTFPFFSKVKIMGSEAEPAFKFLTGGWHQK